MQSKLRHVGTFILLMPILFLLFIGTSVVSGTSMLPTLQNEDIVFYNRFPISLKYNDIVIMYNETVKGLIIKRVIRLPGDTVEISAGTTYINGKAVNDDFDDTWAYTMKSVKVPADCVFVLGDNRNDSLDSRQLGCLSLSNVKGKYIIDMSKELGMQITSTQIRIMLVVIYVIGILIIVVSRR